MSRVLRVGSDTQSLGLIDAAQCGDIERIKAKLVAGKDVNSKDEARHRIDTVSAALCVGKPVPCNTVWDTRYVMTLETHRHPQHYNDVPAA